MTPTRDFTATTFVVRECETLLLWHRKVGAWLPPGGHIHADELPDDAAVREVLEETGLRVELEGGRDRWGEVAVLNQPVCVLLEDIEPGHQHIDLIYFARSMEGTPMINERESSAFRWYSHDDLEGREIAPDIRILGQRAIAEIGAGD